MNRKTQRDGRFLPLNWVTGIIALALLLMLTLGGVMTLHLLENQASDPRELSASSYFIEE